MEGIEREKAVYDARIGGDMDQTQFHTLQGEGVVFMFDLLLLASLQTWWGWLWMLLRTWRGMVLFVVPEKGAEGGPVVRVKVEVLHRGLKGGLKGVTLMTEDPHDGGPGEGSEDGEGGLGVGEGAMLNGDLDEADHDAGKEIENHLLVDTIILPKDEVTTDEACKKGMEGKFLITSQVLLEKHETLVDGDKEGQIPRVGLCGFENDSGLFLESGMGRKDE